MHRKYIIAVLIFTGLGAASFLLLHYVHLSGGGQASNDENTDKVQTVVTVQTGKLERATLRGYVEAFGVVAGAPPENGQPAASTDIASPVAGVVDQIETWEGETVEKGALLFQLNSQVEDVAANFARKTLERQQELLRTKNTSLKAVQDAQQQLDLAVARQELMRIRAPISGTVTRLNIRVGEAVDLKTTLATVTDLHRLVVNAEIPEDEAGEIKPGQEVELQTASPWRSSVLYVSPTTETSNGTVLARVEASATSGLRPGEFVPLRIVTAVHKDCLAAPQEAVVKNSEGKPVLAVVTNDDATQIEVTTGLRENKLVEVRAQGLESGQTVVTVGAYGLPAKTRIRVEKPQG